MQIAASSTALPKATQPAAAPAPAASSGVVGLLEALGIDVSGLGTLAADASTQVATPPDGAGTPLADWSASALGAAASGGSIPIKGAATDKASRVGASGDDGAAPAFIQALAASMIANAPTQPPPSANANNPAEGQTPFAGAKRASAPGLPAGLLTTAAAVGGQTPQTAPAASAPQTPNLNLPTPPTADQASPGAIAALRLAATEQAPMTPDGKFANGPAARADVALGPTASVPLPSPGPAEIATTVPAAPAGAAPPVAASSPSAGAPVPSANADLAGQATAVATANAAAQRPFQMRSSDKTAARPVGAGSASASPSSGADASTNPGPAGPTATIMSQAVAAVAADQAQNGGRDSGAAADDGSGASPDLASGDATRQPEAAQFANAMAQPAQAVLAARVARVDSSTVQRLSAEIVRKVGAKSTRFDLELRPDGLGKVDVNIQIDSAGKLSAAMRFDNPQAAQDMKDRAGDLRAALQQAGFDVADNALSFSFSQDQGSSTGQDSQRPVAGNRAFTQAASAADDLSSAADTAASVSRRRSSGFDIRI